MKKMIRHFWMGLLIAGGLCAVPMFLGGTALADEPVLSDDFDDNARDGSWSLYAEDSSACLMIESSGRLELRAVRRPVENMTAYVGDGWQLDCSADFSLRVDYHYDLRTFEEGSLNIGLTANADDPDAQRIEFGVGCANLFSSFRYEKKNGLSVQNSYISRATTDGTLYVSYNALTDTLYLGDAGYGQVYAWMTVDDLLQKQWEGKPVTLYLGGRSDELDVASGSAYFDNLSVDTGNVRQASLQEVYRFWSEDRGTHFYTISKTERDKLMSQAADVWTYEGVVFYAFAEDVDADTLPVYRFWSDALGVHFYTIVESEKEKLVKKYDDVWAYEGPVFYAYSPDSYPAWSTPVYRFWSPTKKTHFYTVSDDERDQLINEYGDTWTFEGIAWYASN